MILGLSVGVRPAHAQEQREVIVEKVEGRVLLQEQDRGPWVPLLEGMKLKTSDRVKTAADSNADLLIKGMTDARVNIRPDTLVQLSELKQEADGDQTELNLSIGSVLVMAEKLKGESRFEIRNPNSIVGIRGTEFEVVVQRY